jgi:type IV fimbrial biogenesis protein FimT
MELLGRARSNAMVGSSFSGTRWTQAGMTLIEQIMVLAIVSALTSMAVPPIHRLLNRSQLQVAQLDFIAALMHAREAAVTSGRRTLLCPSRDGSRCSGAMRWDDGWLLAHDRDGDHQPDGTPLYVGHAYKAGLTILSSVRRRYVRFDPDGSASGSNLTLIFCSENPAEQALSVVVSNAGRVRSSPASKHQAAICAAAS